MLIQYISTCLLSYKILSLSYRLHAFKAVPYEIPCIVARHFAEINLLPSAVQRDRLGLALQHAAMLIIFRSNDNGASAFILPFLIFSLISPPVTLINAQANIQAYTKSLYHAQKKFSIYIPTKLCRKYTANHTRVYLAFFK